MFQKLDKEALLQKRLEIADLIVERNKKRDEKALEAVAAGSFEGLQILQSALGSYVFRVRSKGSD